MERVYCVFDGKAYDVTDWAPLHPGGRQWITRAHGRDISSLVYTYHSNAELIRKILAKYEVNKKPEDVIHPTLNLPAFTIPEGFDAKRDTVTFDWTKKDTIFFRAVELLSGKDMQKRIKKMDFLFDLVSFLIFATHLFMSFVGVYYQILPLWAFVIFFVCSRTGLAAVGHYHVHRRKDGITDWGDPLFDMQYVGASVIAMDGHAVIHHAYTNSDADAKRTVFAGILWLPRIWRIPAETFRRFAHFLTGMLLRWTFLFFIEITTKTMRPPLK